MNTDNSFKKNNIIDFLLDKVFIYSFIASLMAGFFYANPKIYEIVFNEKAPFWAVDPLTVEPVSVIIIWFMYVIIEKPLMDFKNINKLKFALGFSIITTINYFIIYQNSLKNLPAIEIVYAFIINMLIRTIIIFLIIVTINVIFKVLLKLIGK